MTELQTVNRQDSIETPQKLEGQPGTYKFVGMNHIRGVGDDLGSIRVTFSTQTAENTATGVQEAKSVGVKYDKDVTEPQVTIHDHPRDDLLKHALGELTITLPEDAKIEVERFQKDGNGLLTKLEPVPINPYGSRVVSVYTSLWRS